MIMKYKWRVWSNWLARQIVALLVMGSSPITLPKLFIMDKRVIELLILDMLSKRKSMRITTIRMELSYAFKCHPCEFIVEVDEVLKELEDKNLISSWLHPNEYELVR